MDTKQLIGRTIVDILLWSKWEVGGLDQAEVFIVLDNKKSVQIPWSFDSESIETQPKKGSESLFSDLQDIPVVYINPEKKSIQEILDAKKKKRGSSFFGRIRKVLGLGEGIPREYSVWKTEFQENKLKYLKDQKIVDFLMFDNSDSTGFLELNNGYIIWEITMAQHGTGMAGLHYCESLEEFQERRGTDYKRLSKHGK